MRLVDLACGVTVGVLTAVALLVGGSCGPAVTVPQGSVPPATGTIDSFYCNALDQCWITEAECPRCNRKDAAWCAVYQTGVDSYPERLMCGISRHACLDLVRDLRVPGQHGECVERKASGFLAGYTPAPAVTDERYVIPPLKRPETVVVEAEAAGVDIAAVPFGAAGWKLTITNNTKAVALVVWDESTFVSSGGESLGRLIRGETRKIDTANPQPASPVAVGARLTQPVLLEKAIGSEDFELYLQKAGRTLSKDSLDKATAAREKRRSMIVGGALNVTVQLADGKKTWIGRVSSAGSSTTER
jgi:hypothetical protein